MNKFTFYF